MKKKGESFTYKERWRLWRAGAVKRYYFDLKHNPCHPFEDLGDGFYYITVRSDKFLFGVCLVIAVILAFTLFWVFVGYYSFPLALFFVVLAYGIFSMYGHLSTRELIISRHGGYIMRIKGSNKVLLEEPVHNCYIKLQRKWDSNLASHFYLILGGYRLDDIRISSMADEDVALRLLGGRLAERMGINYFDYDNNSTLHRIIHYPNFTTLRATEEEYYAFLREHFLSKDEVVSALGSEGMPKDTTLLPDIITEQIKGNYKVGARMGRVDIPKPFAMRKTETADTIVKGEEYLMYN